MLNDNIETKEASALIWQPKNNKSHTITKYLPRKLDK